MILGVSFDTAAENKAFAEKFHFNFPLICDTDRTIGTAYGANADPQKGAQRPTPTSVASPTKRSESKIARRVRRA